LYRYLGAIAIYLQHQRHPRGVSVILSAPTDTRQTPDMPEDPFTLEF
jgi:hypothetical protein